MSDKTQHEELTEAFKKSMNAAYAGVTWEAERARIIKEEREQAEREAQHAADLAEAERLRQEAIAESKKLPAGIPIPAELPTISYDPISGGLVRLAGGDKAMAERLLGVPIQE